MCIFTPLQLSRQEIGALEKNKTVAVEMPFCSVILALFT